VDSADARAFEVAFQRDIKIGRINADKDVGPQCGETLRQIAANFQQAPQAAQHLHDPHYRQLFHLIPGFAPFRLHQRPRHPHKACIRMTGFQSTDQTGTKNIAGGFSGDQGNR